MNFQCTLGLFCKAGGELSAAHKNRAPNPVFTHISTYYSMLCLRKVCRTDSANQTLPTRADHLQLRGDLIWCSRNPLLMFFATPACSH